MSSYVHHFFLAFIYCIFFLFHTHIRFFLSYMRISFSIEFVIYISFFFHHRKFFVCILGSCTLISILFLRLVFISQMHFFFRSFSFSIVFFLCSIRSPTSRLCFFFFFFLSFYFFSVLMAFSLSNYPFLFPSCLFIRSFY